MSKRVSHIGHPTAQALLFAGNDREVTIDTSKGTIRVHDSVTKGGIELALASGNNIQIATAVLNGLMTAAKFTELTAATVGVAANLAAIISNDAEILQNQIDIAATVAQTTTNTGNISTNTTKLNTIETGATADQTKADIDALNIDAATLSGLLQSVFSRKANNLSDLANAGTARTNLGLGSMATQNSNAINVTGGVISNVSGVPQIVITQGTIVAGGTISPPSGYTTGQTSFMVSISDAPVGTAGSQIDHFSCTVTSAGVTSGTVGHPGEGDTTPTLNYIAIGVK